MNLGTLRAANLLNPVNPTNGVNPPNLVNLTNLANRVNPTNLVNPVNLVNLVNPDVPYRGRFSRRLTPAGSGNWRPVVSQPSKPAVANAVAASCPRGTITVR